MQCIWKPCAGLRASMPVNSSLGSQRAFSPCAGLHVKGMIPTVSPIPDPLIATHLHVAKDSSAFKSLSHQDAGAAQPMQPEPVQPMV